MADGKIQIFVDGIPNHTRIDAIGAEGVVTPLFVEGIAMDLRSDGPCAGWLRLDCCIHNSVKLELPADGSVIAKLTELFSGESVHAKADSYGKLRRAIEGVIDAIEGDGLQPAYRYANMLRKALSLPASRSATLSA